MARASAKPRPMRSKKSGKKSMKLVASNVAVLKKISQR